MFHHYFLIALRNAWRHRFTSAISVLGLALGLGFFIVAWAIVNLSHNIDRDLPRSDRIYFIAKIHGGWSNTFSAPESLPAYLRSDFPAIERVSQATDYGQMGMSAGTGGKKVAGRLVLADPHFLRLFELPFLQGDSRVGLDKPRSVVLARETAQKLFGSTNAVGRPIRMQGVDLTVTGVLDAIPAPTHLGPNPNRIGRVLAFDALASADVAAQLQGEKATAEEAWTSGHTTRTYMLFPANGSIKPGDFDRDFPAFFRRHWPDQSKTETADKADFAFIARPVSAFSQLEDADATGFLILGSLILVVGCLNYANLATALAIGRTREIGLRKVLGAGSGQLMRQYLFESAFQTALAFATAAIALALLLPVLNSLAGFPVAGVLMGTPSFWFGLLACFCTVSVAAAAYPAIVAARAMPASALRAAANMSNAGFGPKLLVALQFALASFLLIVVIASYMKRETILSMAPDPSADPVVLVSDLKPAGVNLDAFGALLRQSPHVAGFSATQGNLWGGFGPNLIGRTQGPDDVKLTVTWRAAYFDYFETMGIKLLAGRSFSRGRTDDIGPPPPRLPQPPLQRLAPRPHNIVVDAAFTARMNWTPQEAVGKVLYAKYPVVTPVTIIGVVEDSAASTGDPLTRRPSVYQLGPTPEPGPSDATAIIHVRKSELPAALADIDAAWDRLAPTTPIARQFLAENFEQLYAGFRKPLLILSGFVACGFLVAISGLAGMAVHVVSRRTREIGIRKTLGSTVSGILRLLMLSFTKPIIAGCVLGWLLAYASPLQIGNQFGQPQAIGPLPFLLSLVITVFIGAVAVAVPAWRAARLNPAEVLHYE